jgi:hypothetical protein
LLWTEPVGVAFFLADGALDACEARAVCEMMRLEVLVGILAVFAERTLFWSVKVGLAEAKRHHAIFMLHDSELVLPQECVVLRIRFEREVELEGFGKEVLFGVRVRAVGGGMALAVTSSARVHFEKGARRIALSVAQEVRSAIIVPSVMGLGAKRTFEGRPARGLWIHSGCVRIMLM